MLHRHRNAHCKCFTISSFISFGNRKIRIFTINISCAVGVLRVFLVICFFLLRVNEPSQSWFKCLRPLSSYITDPVPFMCFPGRTPVCLTTLLFYHAPNIRQVLFPPKNRQIIAELPLCFTVEGKHCHFTRQTKCFRLFSNCWVLYSRMNNNGH